MTYLFNKSKKSIIIWSRKKPKGSPYFLKGILAPQAIQGGAILVPTKERRAI